MINDPTLPGTQLTTAQTGLTQQVNNPQFSTSGMGGGGGLFGGKNGFLGANKLNKEGVNTSFWRNADSSFNMDSMGLVFGGLEAIGGIWNAYQQNKIARDQMKFQKSQFKAQLGDQRQSYNTALEDRIRARHAFEGKGGGATDKYLDKHSL